MIKTLDRYILRNLLVGLAVGAVALIALIWLINSLKFLDWFVNKGLSIGTFLKLTLLLMPGFLTVFIPIALFAVVLFTYNKFASDRELIVMRAAGQGHWQLAKPALWLCLMLTVVGYWLTMSVVPAMERAFDVIKWQVRDEVSSLVIKDGQFNQIQEGVIVYAGQRTKDGKLLDLLIHDTSGEKDVTVIAESGAMVKDGGSSKILLLNGNRQERDPKTGKVTFLYFDSYTIDMGEDGGGGEFRYIDERQRPFSELYSIQVGDRIDPAYPYLFEHPNVRRLRMELHLRILRPLAHIGFLLLGLAAVLTGEFNRRGDNTKVIVAVALVVLFQGGSLGAANLVKKSYDALILLDLMTVLPFVIGLLWLTWPNDRWPLGRKSIRPELAPEDPRMRVSA
ncbi:MAG: LPS export ABC transporter permease LptF [Rhodospirillum sp.]|nr:LPS export ABC transporter permease LptF [Rhodospirillum sp.]MCF8488655.1 LPS export ABC transporter permease LptF [Rhodospirillum sp.]MCF8501740.1 LPS export ABC transporter permease LptF [Rhodospirillum sp.]